MEVLPRRAQRSLLRLASLMGEEVLSIPVNVFDDRYTRYPAYTTSAGIFIGQSIIDNEPQNIGTYFAHEILHHVVEDPLVRTLFDAATVNESADYIINYILKSIYGLDVRKVKHRGIYDAKFKNKTLHQACQIVAKSDGNNVGCGVNRILTNPVVYKVASSVREKLVSHSTLSHLEFGRVREIVKLDDVQDQTLYEELRDKFWRAYMRPLPNVDYDLLVRALFGRLYAPVVKYDIRRDMPHLAHSHGIALSVRVDKLRSMTRNDAAMSLTFAIELAKTLAEWGTSRWKNGQVIRLEQRIDALTNKMAARSAYSKAERVKFAQSRDRAYEKVAKIKATPMLDTYLTVDNMVKVKARNEKATGSLIQEILTVKEDHLPRMVKNELVEEVRKITRRSFRTLRELYNVKSRLEAFVNRKRSTAVKSVEEKEEQREEIEDDTVDRQQLPRAPRRPIILPKPAKEESANDGQPSDEEQSQGVTESGSTDSADDKDGDDTDELVQQDAKGDGEVSDEHPEEEANEEDDGEESLTAAGGHVPDSEAGDGVGAGDGESVASVDMKLLSSVRTNARLLKKILVEADIFREKLSNVSRSHVDPNAVIDRTYTFGDEIQKADSSVMAKMVHKATRLAFFADVANHALLQNTGTAPRRGSVIIAIDCSGSMAGERYVVAAGFAVAMFNIMADINRGCALIKFASNVDGMYVCDKNVPIDMLTLVESLVAPSLGGTSFDAAFEQGLLLQETLDWPNTQMILVTDGEGQVSRHLMESVSKKMRVTAVIVRNHASVIEGIGDTKHIASLDDLRNGLVGIGRSLC